MEPPKLNIFSPFSCKGFDQPLTLKKSEFSPTHTFYFLTWQPSSLPHPFFPSNKGLLSTAIKILGKKGLVLYHSYSGLDSSEFLEKIEVAYKTSLWQKKGNLKREVFSQKTLEELSFLKWVFTEKQLQASWKHGLAATPKAVGIP